MRTLLIGNTKCHATRRLHEEFTLRGFSFDSVTPNDIVFSVQNGVTTMLTKEGKDLLAYDVYFFRGLGTIARELSVIANYLSKQNKVIIEDVFAHKAPYFDKFSPTMVDDGIPVIDYQLIFSLPEDSVNHYTFPIIAKNLDGSMGLKVRLLHNTTELHAFVEKFGFPLLLQKYIPIQFDYRVMVVDGKVLGAMKRYNSRDDFLTVRAGGVRESVELPQEALDVALRSTAVAGLSVAGVDLLEHKGIFYRIEVNMSPQFRVFEKTTHINVAGAICDMAERRYHEAVSTLVTHQYTDVHQAFSEAQ
jgi:RimK family alpha-L-glutamate ligase